MFDYIPGVGMGYTEHERESASLLSQKISGNVFQGGFRLASEVIFAGLHVRALGAQKESWVHVHK